MRACVLFPIVAMMLGCSESSNSAGDGPPPATGDAAIREGGTKTGDGKEGDPCDQSSQCQSGICHAGACARGCTDPAQCESGQECTSDDGKRLFCHTPGYPAGLGQPCAITGTCPAGTTCLGGVHWASAYCTASCQSDVDCPPRLTCDEYAPGQKRCIRRLFCTRCYHDANCGPGKLCIKQGSNAVCSRPCAVGSTECPRFATCQEVGGKHVCVHKAGACDGDGTLCQPCHNTDCNAGGFCLVNIFTGERFCGQDCSAGGCPSGYDCVGVGGADRQCAPHYDSALKQMQGCVQISPIGQQGDVLEDFAMVGYTDANGDGSLVGEELKVLRLSDHAKAKIILFNLSAGWCKPCKQETQQFASLIKTYGPKGLAIFQAIFDAESPGDPPTVGLLDGWIKAYKPLGAVGIDVDAESIIYNTTGTTPVNMILDAKTRKVLHKSHGFSKSGLESKIKTHLGLP